MRKFSWEMSAGGWGGRVAREKKPALMNEGDIILGSMPKVLHRARERIACHGHLRADPGSPGSSPCAFSSFVRQHFPHTAQY